LASKASKFGEKSKIRAIKWSFAWYKNLDTSFSHSVTNHAFDRWTDRILIARLRLHCIPCSMV